MILSDSVAEIAVFLVETHESEAENRSRTHQTEHLSRRFLLLNREIFALQTLRGSLLNYSPDNEPVPGCLRGKTITRKQLEITTTTTTTDIPNSQPVSRDFVGYAAPRHCETTTTMMMATGRPPGSHLPENTHVPLSL